MVNQTTIVCPHCKTEFPLTDALSHEYEIKAEAKIKQELEMAMKDKTNEAEELRKDNKKLQDQQLELNKSIRELMKSNEQRDLEYQKRLMVEEEKIKQESKLREAEKEKVISDLKLALDDAQKKAAQGSQQTQGEALELELEKVLRMEFPTDTISEIKKGVHGADISQEIVDRNGRQCGKILWESKNAEWSPSWAAKLREDQRDAKAELAVLVSKNIPKDIKTFIFRDGIWISSISGATALAYALRFNLIQVNMVKTASLANKDEKDELFNYVQSLQFQHKVEAMLEAYKSFLDDIDKQKRYFSSTWARQEKAIHVLIEQTGAIHGELSGIVGKALPDVRNLSLEIGGE